MPLQQAAEPNLTEHTLERLRKMILCGDLAAGTPLARAYLCGASWCFADAAPGSDYPVDH
jgi:DNA-binding GntR family transcriptional regulator